MIVIVCFLFLIIMILAILLGLILKTINDLNSQLRFQMTHDSNLILTGPLCVGSMKKLKDTLNEWVSFSRSQRRKQIGREQNLADMYVNLSHDIRTPLTSLDGYVQLLGDNPSDKDRERYLGVIQERIGCLNTMLEELFTYSKLKNEIYQIELSNVSVTRILKDTILSYYDDWMKLGTQPQITITNEQVYMMGNEVALKRVFQNLCKNAMDHGEQQIKIKLTTEKGKIIIEVWNHKMVNDVVDTSKIFDQFYQSDVSRHRNHSGLGLAIAKEFVQRMNGNIKAVEKEDEFGILISFPKS